METDQGRPAKASNRPQGTGRSSCPSCRKPFVATSREERELQSAGQLHQQCKGCGKALVVTRSADGGLDVILDFRRGPDEPQAPSRRAVLKETARSSEIASLVNLSTLRSQPVPAETGRTPGGAKPIGLETAQEEPQPPSPDETTRHAPGRAAVVESIDGLQKCLAQILKIVERLPDVFDFVEMELRACRPADDASPAPERRSIVAELEKLQQRIRAWQASVGLIRFPNPGDAFDANTHDVESVAQTDDVAKADSVKEVVGSGYRLGTDGPILRRARVVRWVKQGRK
jgi:molecular chaperone GrpE